MDNQSTVALFFNFIWSTLPQLADDMYGFAAFGQQTHHVVCICPDSSAWNRRKRKLSADEQVFQGPVVAHCGLLRAWRFIHLR